MKQQLRHILIGLVALLIGISALVGGYGLVMKDGLGMPVAWLTNSPFDSYVIPGLILFLIVGGTYILAAIMTWKQHHYAAESLGIAGFGLLIWIFTEIYMMNQPHWLQVLYFIFGIMTVVTAFLQLKFQKSL